MSQWRDWGFKGKCGSNITRYIQSINNPPTTKKTTIHPANLGYKDHHRNKITNEYLSTVSLKIKKRRRGKVQTTLTGGIAMAEFCEAYGHVLGPKLPQFMRFVSGNVNNLHDKHYFSKSSCIVSFIRQIEADGVCIAEMGRN
jgi:hypothetical protein